VLPIAIDVMSGDRGPGERIAGVVQALLADPQLSVLLTGQPDEINTHLRAHPEGLRQRIGAVAASQVIAMDTPPRVAIRGGRDSSMRVAINLVGEGRAAACVSAGNTGALTAMAHYVLKTVAQVERAAIVSAIPSEAGHTLMLDLGANTRASEIQLLQFATMGAVVARELSGIGAPRVGLLNIGEEDIKGHDTVRAAHALLQHSPLNYIGFVEGDHIFSDRVDVVVTDGFTGNVALKTMEGLARMVSARTRREFATGFSNRLAAWLARPSLRRLAQGLDPRRYNGACMVGLGGVVVKSHGRADATAFARAVELAATLGRGNLCAQVAQAFVSQGR
jgi:glycerol-3-phosphate acyltransferase PlsX